MRFIYFVLTFAFTGIVNAHFQLQYPFPRGPFVRNLEPTFCDGYTDAVSNRTKFPMSGGVIDLNSEHPIWDVGVIISTMQNPTSFADFESTSGYQMAVQYFQTSGEGKFCFPINITASGVPGIKDGVNVTIQVVYDGGDGTLFQASLCMCADLALSADMTIPSDAVSSCTNITGRMIAKTSAAGKNTWTIVSCLAAATLTTLLSLL